MTESDLRSTLNLPKTDFPMKANLKQKELETPRLCRPSLDGGGRPHPAGIAGGLDKLRAQVLLKH